MMRRGKASAKPAKLRRSRADEKYKPEYWDRVNRFYRPMKEPVTLRLDADVIEWFKREGQGYQTRINRALRNLMLVDMKRKK
jgi:uncharacterized protein (DUF4415 family)